MTMSQALGCRSRLVLEKLGFDLRPYLDATLTAPFPAAIQKLADELQGYVAWRDVGDVTAGDPVRTAHPDGVCGDADDTFRFVATRVKTTVE